jgi:hypothetical protein
VGGGAGRSGAVTWRALRGSRKSQHLSPGSWEQQQQAAVAAAVAAAAAAAAEAAARQENTAGGKAAAFFGLRPKRSGRVTTELSALIGRIFGVPRQLLTGFISGCRCLAPPRSM